MVRIGDYINTAGITMPSSTLLPLPTPSLISNRTMDGGSERGDESMGKCWDRLISPKLAIRVEVRDERELTAMRRTTSPQGKKRRRKTKREGGREKERRGAKTKKPGRAIGQVARREKSTQQTPAPVCFSPGLLSSILGESVGPERAHDMGIGMIQGRCEDRAGSGGWVVGGSVPHVPTETMGSRCINPSSS